MSSITTLRISEETKARFDNAWRILNLRAKKMLTQDEVEAEILSFWEETNIEKEDF